MNKYCFAISIAVKSSGNGIALAQSFTSMLTDLTLNTPVASFENSTIIGNSFVLRGVVVVVVTATIAGFVTEPVVELAELVEVVVAELGGVVGTASIAGGFSGVFVAELEPEIALVVATELEPEIALVAAGNVEVKSNSFEPGLTVL